MLHASYIVKKDMNFGVYFCTRPLWPISIAVRTKYVQTLEGRGGGTQQGSHPQPPTPPLPLPFPSLILLHGGRRPEWSDTGQFALTKVGSGGSLPGSVHGEPVLREPVVASRLGDPRLGFGADGADGRGSGRARRSERRATPLLPAPQAATRATKSMTRACDYGNVATSCSTGSVGTCPGPGPGPAKNCGRGRGREARYCARARAPLSRGASAVSTSTLGIGCTRRNPTRYVSSATTSRWYHLDGVVCHTMRHND